MISVVKDLIVELVVTVTLAVILAVIAFLKRKAIKTIVIKWRYLIVARRNLTEFKKEIRKHSPEIRALMARIAFTTVTHLFQSEEITLDEYGDLLNMSLNKNLEECIFIARTKPSQWYPTTSEDNISKDEKATRRIDFDLRIQEYFGKQKDLKHCLRDKLKIRRYIIIPRSDWDGDGSKQQFIKDHGEAKIELFFCDVNKLSSSFDWKDVAIFMCKQKRKWSVVGLNFNEETIERYLDGVETCIKVKIEEGALLDAEYTNKLKKLDRLAEPVVSLGYKFYYQKEVD